MVAFFYILRRPTLIINKERIIIGRQSLIMIISITFPLLFARVEDLIFFVVFNYASDKYQCVTVLMPFVCGFVVGDFM